MWEKGGEEDLGFKFSIVNYTKEKWLTDLSNHFFIFLNSKLDFNFRPLRTEYFLPVEWKQLSWKNME